MSHHTLTITDLPYLESTDQCCLGAVARATTATYAGPGVAVAAAAAFASGDIAKTFTRTEAVVRELPNVTFSRASAFSLAISYDDQGLQIDRSRSSSFYIGLK